MITHKMVSGRLDDGDAGDINPSNWNDEHVVDGLLGALLSIGMRANAVPYLDADQAGQLTDLSTFGRSLIALASGGALRDLIAAAPLSSPQFTDTPTAPTAPLGTATTQIATMAALQAMRDNLVNAAPGALDTLRELATALGDDPNFASTVTATLAAKQPLATVLTNLVALASAADTAVYFTGASAPALMTLTAFARGFAACATAAAARAALGLGSAAVLAAGAAANNLVQLDGTGKLPALDGSALTAITAAWSAISGKPTFGTAALLNAGVAANQLVQMTAGAKLPAVDGSLLTNVNVALPPSPIFTGLITAAGGQIAFPATQNASADPNVLDDYEEGTFTPTGYGQTFTSVIGSYTKIGRLVHVDLSVVWSTNGAGNAGQIRGLPFVVAAQASFSCGVNNCNAERTFYAAIGSTFINVLDWSAVTVSDAAMSAATIYLSGSYPTT